MFEYSDKEKSKYLMCYLNMILLIFTNSEKENKWLIVLPKPSQVVLAHDRWKH